MRWRAFPANRDKLPNHKDIFVQRMTYKVNEVALLLGLSRTTIYKLMGQGELRQIKLGASTLIAADSVDALLLRHAV